MDFDLDIISEEDDCPNHLFESIMNAMNSMKEATADKIYHKIQRDGETNYSKPQVDKALANALKYGIFEVRNNRYRVRDDILDDEDTVYWKLHEKKDRTPFRIQEHLSEKQFGLKLDPEKDNQRFRKLQNTETHQCPHCGRLKKFKQKNKKSHIHKKSEKLTKKKRKNNKASRKNNQASYRISGMNRKGIRARKGEDSNLKQRKTNKTGKGKVCISNDKLLNDFWIETKHLREGGSIDSRYSNMNILEADSVENLTNENQDVRYKENEFCHSQRFPESEAGDEKISDRSNDTESESSVANPQNLESHEDFWDSVTKLQEKKLSQRNETKGKSTYMRSMNEYHNQYNDQTGQAKGESDWLGPQGTIIQSHNVLTIEPMDTLAFESPEKASYIT